MYYVSETQLNQILAVIKALPVKADTFDAADIWVGLYLTVQDIANHPVKDDEGEDNQDAD